MKTIFFDIDSQLDFLYPAGALYVPGAEHIVPAIARLNHYAAAHGIPVISTTDAHTENDPEFRDWPPHCVAGTTGQARTTVLTIMERLRRKGHLIRKKIGGVYRYSPKVAKQILLQTLVRNFVDTTLGGSVSPFVAFLSESGPISTDDLDTLKRLVRDLEDRRKEH